MATLVPRPGRRENGFYAKDGGKIRFFDKKRNTSRKIMFQKIKKCLRKLASRGNDVIWCNNSTFKLYRLIQGVKLIDFMPKKRKNTGFDEKNDVKLRIFPWMATKWLRKWSLYIGVMILYNNYKFWAVRGSEYLILCKRRGSKWSKYTFFAEKMNSGLSIHF